MARTTTLPLILQPLMGKPSVTLPRCAVCGRNHPLEQHHVVRRSAGRMWDEGGRELRKPTITLCGFGNNLRDHGGNEYCHGLAHANRLHFRWVGTKPDHVRPGTFGVSGTGHWEYLLLDEPTSYADALDMDGWEALP